MNILSIVALVILLAVALRLIYTGIILPRRLKAHDPYDENAAPSIDADILADIAWYRREKEKTRPNPAAIDAITWNDLDMDAVFAHLNRTQSVAGEEILYSILHEVDAPDQTLARRRALIDAFHADESLRGRVGGILRRIGKNHFHGLSLYLFHPTFKEPRYLPLYISLALLPVASLILCAVVHPLFIIAFLALFLIGLIIHFTSGKTWKREITAVSYLTTVVRAADRLIKANDPALKTELDELRALLPPLKPLRKWGTLFLMERVGDLDFITDYIKILFQLNMISLCMIARHMSKRTEEINRLYALVGEIDAMLAVAAVRAAEDRYAHPQFTEAATIDARNVTHPLIRQAVPNDLNWEKNILITGSNASGKSTFTKAMAVNAILAQTIHTVSADSFRMPRARVITSMAVKDDIRRGESYFIAEIKSLKRMLDGIRPDRISLCFIDEILRGTNTVERIAASTSLLRYIAGENVRLMAATHDGELTTLLAGDYENRHFREEIRPEGMVFTYKLMDGPASTRNAIALLDQMKFPAAVVEGARSLSAHFDAARTWE